MYISREKGDHHLTSKHGTAIFSSHYNLFLGKLKEKLARKALVNTDASILDRVHAPKHPIILLKSNYSIWPLYR